jgi:histidinol dehydrogenase
MKRTTLSKMTPASLSAIGPAAALLADSESLEAHGLSIRERLNQINSKAKDS